MYCKNGGGHTCALPMNSEPHRIESGAAQRCHARNRTGENRGQRCAKPASCAWELDSGRIVYLCSPHLGVLVRTGDLDVPVW